MGDSEDEYDRKRRDKFRGERAEPTYRGAERPVRPRDEWQERDAWSRPRPRDYRGPVRDRGYSPSLEAAPKRLRHDFYGEGYYNHYQPYHQPAHRAGNFFREPPAPQQSEGQQPPMMSFKAFLATQDDNISDSDAIEKYNDYKLEFQRQQLNEFFVAHKDDEWFRLKYHPEDSVRRKDEQMAALKKRVQVFINLLNSKKVDGVSVDCVRTNDLLKLLDTVVIMLEGGTEEDLAILEHEHTEIEEKKHEPKPEEVIVVEKKPELPEIKSAAAAATIEDGELEGEKIESGANINGDDEKKKGSDDDVTNETESKAQEANDKMEVDEDPETNSEKVTEKDSKAAEDVVKTDEPVVSKEKKRKRSYSGSSSSSSTSSSDTEDDKVEPAPVQAEKPPENEPLEVKEADEPPQPQPQPEEVAEKEPPPIIIETIADDVVVKVADKPKSLHKTTSIFLRNLASTITRQEVESICSRYDGFLRIALADPQPERRWLRRGWVTFKRDANIKEICWNLNNIRLRDCELGAIVNRDLSRRIRPVNGITAHKQVVRSDIRISAKVTLHLDSKAGLWTDEERKEKVVQQTFGLVSNNPVLHNITDYLIEEASAEEEELLGLEQTVDSQDAATTVERDDTLISVLDRIILYLRIVHSVDYYNHCEYPNEDEMPNRCGILHARGPPPTAKTDVTQFIGAAVESKMSNFLPDKPSKPEDNKNELKLVNLSLKDVDMEIDKFVQANTRELAKDKWLCPLSGKKFKGPDFVRKHIFNKHAEKLEEVKKEVEFFNNYLKDPKRPMLAETTQPKREEPPPYSHPTYMGSYGGYGGPPRYYNQGYSQRSRGYAPRGRGGGGGDFRPVIHYRDLDAPREPEEFI